MNKKGALQLSVNAIVIIVLAMTVLGLGLTFTTGLFEDMNLLRQQTFDSISKDLSTRLSTSEEPLIFSVTRLDLGRNSESTQGIGIRNDGNSLLEVGIKFFWISCPEAYGGCENGDFENWFIYDDTAESIQIGPGQSETKRVTIKPKGDIKKGLHMFKIVVYTGEECGRSDCDTVDTTEFFVNVS